MSGKGESEDNLRIAIISEDKVRRRDRARDASRIDGRRASTSAVAAGSYGPPVVRWCGDALPRTASAHDRRGAAGRPRRDRRFAPAAAPPPYPRSASPRNASKSASAAAPSSCWVRDPCRSGRRAAMLSAGRPRRHCGEASRPLACSRLRAFDAGKLCIEVTPTAKVAWISEDLCIGCGICVNIQMCMDREAAVIERAHRRVGLAHEV